jgi:hypothetical protein
VIKITLVGELNPYGGDDYFALYPAPDGCSGHRLCKLVLGMRRDVYLDTFERVNLCEGKWSVKEARVQAESLWTSPDAGRFILLGRKVCDGWRIPFKPFSIFDVFEDTAVLVLPHPSGLNRLWNAETFLRARLAVAAFVPEIAHLLGQAEEASEPCS